jgi:hypothetical protein
VCVCVCVRLYIYIHTQTRKHTRTHIHTYTHMDQHTHTHTTVATTTTHTSGLRPWRLPTSLAPCPRYSCVANVFLVCCLRPWRLPTSLAPCPRYSCIYKPKPGSLNPLRPCVIARTCEHQTQSLRVPMFYIVMYLGM